MRKIHFIFIAAALFTQACGSSSTNNADPVTVGEASGTTGDCPTSGCGTTSSPTQVYSQCAAYSGQTTTVTSGGVNVAVCRYEAAQGEFDISATAMNISGSSASGGTVTSLQLDPGDTLEVISLGHYSLTTGGGCSTGIFGNGGGDVSVLGNFNGTLIDNSLNNLNAGLWFAFENSNGQYTTPVNATVQSSGNSNQSSQDISVPLGSATNTLVLGYNPNGTIACGDMGVIYAVIRCADANGNTYACN